LSLLIMLPAGGLLSADDPTAGVKSELRLLPPQVTPPEQPPAIAADLSSDGFGPRPAVESTLEMHIARRPWLLEKLSEIRASEPTNSLAPPRPPSDLSDPPSMSRIVPQMPATADRSAPLPLRDPVPLQQITASPAAVPDVFDDEDVPAPAPANAPAKNDLHDSDAAWQAVDGDNEPPPLDPSQSEDLQSDDIQLDDIQLDDVHGESSAQVESIPHELDRELLDAKVTVPKQRTKVSPSGPNYVGDLDRSEPPAAIVERSAPTVPLDYSGRPRESFTVNRDVLRMQGMLQQCLRYYYDRPDAANERSNWGMMHAIMVYGIDTKIIVGRQRYSAIAWIAGNNACRGQKLLTAQDGRITAENGIGLQGHQGQFLAILSLVGVPSSYKLYANQTPYTVNDLVDSEMLACRRGEELTFTLIGLSHYLDTASEWRNEAGEKWDFETLIREELSQPIVGAACGGTHRLMGFGHALRARRSEGAPIEGQWQRAEEYVNSFVDYTYRLQNRDGSMSTNWFEGREDTGDLDRKIQTTGHMVEWLLTVTPDSELQNPRLVNAIQFLLKSMYHSRGKDWEIGPKGHALRSLAMYYERVYQSGPAWQDQTLARGGNSRQR
jgi:hypothetical protein